MMFLPVYLQEVARRSANHQVLPLASPGCHCQATGQLPMCLSKGLSRDFQDRMQYSLLDRDST